MHTVAATATHKASFNGNCKSLWNELFVVELCSVILAGPPHQPPNQPPLRHGNSLCVNLLTNSCAYPIPLARATGLPKLEPYHHMRS